eukprot:2968459-Rhodomonas_salina.1
MTLITGVIESASANPTLGQTLSRLQMRSHTLRETVRGYSVKRPVCIAVFRPQVKPCSETPPEPCGHLQTDPATEPRQASALRP